MSPFEREVRAAVFAMLVRGARPVDATTLAEENGWAPGEVSDALASLADGHRLALTPDGAIWMAHPFSGVPTVFRAVVGDRSHYANCAWDSLAILALLGDGLAMGPDGLAWEVSDGRVDPDGIVHLLVPAREFWVDIGFT